MQTWRTRASAWALLASCALAPWGAQAQSAAPVANAGYQATNLVSDIPGKAQVTDPNLVNPWGIAFFPGGAFWINDNGTGLATLYTGTGAIIPVAFTIPGPAGKTSSTPTGMIINVTQGFAVPGTKLPAFFIFSTEDGTVSAWAANLPSNPLDAVLAVDNSKSGAVYKGLEFGVTAAGTFIYATNFHAGTIDVFDSSFAPANGKLLGKFQDADIQPGYAPFGIRNIDGNLFVTYAKQNAAKHDDLAGPGRGYVDVFDTDGRLLQRFAAGGLLNAPWAIARAPDGFGALSNRILIGNFGSGQIVSYDKDGRFRGLLEDKNARPIVLPGLWALTFGGGVASTPRTLFFTAGIDHEAHGLFGSIAPN